MCLLKPQQKVRKKKAGINRVPPNKEKKKETAFFTVRHLEKMGKRERKRKMKEVVCSPGDSFRI